MPCSPCCSTSWECEHMSDESSSSPAIEVSHLKCGYEGRVILNDVSFTVRSGEIFFVIGGSGCGKSTLLRNMIGIQTPMSGTVSFFGESFTAGNTRRRREFLKTFGVLYQGGALWTS